MCSGSPHSSAKVCRNRFNQLVLHSQGSLQENRHLIRLALLAAVSLSIAGCIRANTGSQQSSINTGKHFKTISIVIFLLVAGLLVVQTRR